MAQEPGQHAHEVLLLEDDENLLDEGPPPSWWQRFVVWAEETYGISISGVSMPRPMAVLEDVKNNWKSGLTVSLVSVPLSVSLAIANGGTPVMGIITALYAGFFSALLGGSGFNIHGPTGALSGIVAGYAAQFGDGVLPFLAILSGIISSLFFFFRLDRYVMFIPSAVMHGFTFGVAFIIGFGQLQFALGLDARELGIPKHQEFFLNVYENLRFAGDMNPWAVAIFLFFLATLFFLVNRWPKVPWTIVISACGILLGWLSDAGHLGDLGLYTLKSKYSDLNDPQLTGKFFTLVRFEARFFDLNVFVAAISVSFISVLETLISAKIAERMTNVGFNQPKEVAALAIANIAAGVFGGLPATAALARTALNIKSGATGRMSGVINAIGILLISLVLLWAFKYLLLPVIAAILVVVAVRMVEVHEMKHMFAHDKKMFVLSIVVTLVVIFDNPTDGIIVGAIAALFMFAAHNSKGHGEAIVGRGSRMLSHQSLDQLDKSDAHDGQAHGGSRGGARRRKVASGADEYGDTLVIRIPGELTYLNAPSHLERAKRMPDKYRTVVLALRYLFYLDMDGLDALGDIVKELERAGKQVLIAGVHDSVEDMLVGTRWYKEKQEAGWVFATYKDALAALDELSESEHVDTSQPPHIVSSTSPATAADLAAPTH